MKLYNLDTVLNFGKYKGETVVDILKKNTSYIMVYCLKESEDFYITDEVYEASIIYGYKGSIDAHVENGKTAEEVINICKEVDPNKYETLRARWLQQQFSLVDKFNEVVQYIKFLKKFACHTVFIH